MRLVLCTGIFALTLSGCSPAAHIAVTVRSPSDISFRVTTEKDDPGCIDHLVVRDTGGVTKWELTRQAKATECLQELVFPNVPLGFAAQQNGTVLAKGNYEVAVKSGVYQGVSDFSVN